MFQCESNIHREHPEVPDRQDKTGDKRERDASKKSKSREKSRQMVQEYNEQEAVAKDKPDSQMQKKAQPTGSYQCGRCDLVMYDADTYAKHAARVKCDGTMIMQCCTSCETHMPSWEGVKKHVEEVREILDFFLYVTMSVANDSSTRNIVDKCKCFI